MNLTRYQNLFGTRPFNDEFKHLVDRLMRDSDGQDESKVVTSEWVPRVDIAEEKNRFVIAADLPGVDPESIEVNMDKGILSIKGERHFEQKQESDRHVRIERAHGVFHRRFALPDSADAEKISASNRHGVLEVIIPKRPESTPRRIQVQ